MVSVPMDRRKRPRNCGYYLDLQSTPDLGHAKERLSAVMKLVSAAWPDPRHISVWFGLGSQM